MSYNLALMRNVGAWLKSAYALAHTDAVAAGSGDATEVDGESVDLLGLGTNPLSGKLMIPCQATLDTGETLTITANIQDSPTGTDQWADFGDALAATIIIPAAATDAEFEGMAELDVNLSGSRQFVRCQVTPDLSRAGTDTAEIAGVWVFGGADELPFTSTV